MTYRSHTPLAWGARTSSSYVKPTGTAEHDVLTWVQIVAHTSVPAAVPTPDGWELIDSEPWNYRTTAYGHLYVWRKVAGASEPASYSVNHATSSYSEGIILADSNISNTSPYDGVDIHITKGTTAVAGATVAAGSITPLTNGAVIRTIRLGWDGIGVAATSGFTERADFAALHVQDMLQPSAASTGPIVVGSGNGAGANKPWVAITIAMRDASAPEPGPYEPSYLSQVELAIAGEDQLRIMFGPGNSFEEGEGGDEREDRWADLVVHDLRTILGIAGQGVGHTPPRYNTYLSESLSWRTPAVSVPSIGTKTFVRAATNTTQFTFTGTGFTVFYNGGAGLGPITVAVDGVTTDTIPAQTSGLAHTWHKTGLSDTTHTVLLTAGTGGARHVGLASYRGGDSPTSGLSYLDWCWTGEDVTFFMPGQPGDITGMRYNPHLIIENKHGSNDYLQAETNPALGLSPDAMADAWQDRITEYRSWPSKPLIVGLVLPYMPVGSVVDETAVNAHGATLDTYRNAYKAVGEANDGVVIVDCRELVTLTLADLAADNLHIKREGQQAMANGIISTLLSLSGYSPPPLRIGDREVLDVKAGDNQVIGIAIGDNMIWSRGS